MVLEQNKTQFPPLYDHIFLINGSIKHFHGFFNIPHEISLQMFPYLILQIRKDHAVPRKVHHISLDPC